MANEWRKGKHTSNASSSRTGDIGSIVDMVKICVEKLELRTILAGSVRRVARVVLHLLQPKMSIAVLGNAGPDSVAAV